MHARSSGEVHVRVRGLPGAVLVDGEEVEPLARAPLWANPLDRAVAQEHAVMTIFSIHHQQEKQTMGLVLTIFHIMSDYKIKGV